MSEKLNYAREVKDNLIRQRQNTDKLIERMKILNKADQVLLKMHLIDGYTYQQLSALAGVSVSTVHRRVHRISKRLMSDNIALFYENKDRFEPREKLIITDYLRDGLSQRKISQKRRITRYRVRKAMAKLESLKNGFYRLGSNDFSKNI